MAIISNLPKTAADNITRQTIQKGLRRIDIEPSTHGFTRADPLWVPLAGSMSRYRVNHKNDDLPPLDRLQERLFMSWITDTPLSLTDVRSLSQTPETSPVAFLRPIPLIPSAYASLHIRLAKALPELYRPLIPPAPITKYVEETGTDLGAWPPRIHTTRASYPEKIAEMEKHHHAHLTRHGVSMHAIAASNAGTTPVLHVTSPLTGMVCAFELHARHAHILNLWIDKSRAPDALLALGLDPAKNPKLRNFNANSETPPPPPKEWYDEFEDIFDAPQWVSIREKAVLEIADYGPSRIAPTCRLLTGKSTRHFPMNPRTLTPEHHLTASLDDSERELFNSAHKDHEAHIARGLTPIYAGLPFEIDPSNPDFRPGDHEWRMTAPLHPKVRVELEKFMEAIETKIPYADMEAALRRAAAPLLDKMDKQITETRNQLYILGE